MVVRLSLGAREPRVPAAGVMTYPIGLAMEVDALRKRVTELERTIAAAPWMLQPCPGEDARDNALPQGPLPDGIVRGLIRRDG